MDETQDDLMRADDGQWDSNGAGQFANCYRHLYHKQLQSNMETKHHHGQAASPSSISSSLSHYSGDLFHFNELPKLTSTRQTSGSMNNLIDNDSPCRTSKDNTLIPVMSCSINNLNAIVSDTSLGPAQSGDKPALGPTQVNNSRSSNSLQIVEPNSDYHLSPTVVSCSPSQTPRGSFMSTDSMVTIGSNNSVDHRTPTSLHSDEIQVAPMHQQHQQRLINGCLLPKSAIELELIVGLNSTLKQTCMLNAEHHSQQTSGNHRTGASRWLRTPSPSNHDTSAMAQWSGKRHSAELTEVGSNLNKLSSASATNTKIICLFARPTGARGSAKSPLMFYGDKFETGIASNSYASSSSTKHSYYLVQTKVAYANGRNQRVIEVKRYHQRSLKYRHSSDMASILKAIAKARVNLVKDLNSWLQAALVCYLSEQQQLQLPATIASSMTKTAATETSKAMNRELESTSTSATITTTSFNHRRHSSCSGPNQSGQISLITFTVQIEIDELLKNLNKMSSASSNSADAVNNQTRLALPQQMDVFVVRAGRNERHYKGKNASKPTTTTATTGTSSTAKENDPGPNRTRPVSSIEFATKEAKERPAQERPASSLCVDVRGAENEIAGSKKHVRFRLHQAPNESQDGQHGSTLNQAYHMLPQRRIWIDESLFVSCQHPDGFRPMEMLADGLKGARNAR